MFARSATCNCRSWTRSGIVTWDSFLHPPARELYLAALPLPPRGLRREGTRASFPCALAKVDGRDRDHPVRMRRAGTRRGKLTIGEGFHGELALLPSGPVVGHAERGRV